jgi:hypothetical protein
MSSKLTNKGCYPFNPRQPHMKYLMKSGGVAVDINKPHTPLSKLPDEYRLSIDQCYTSAKQYMKENRIGRGYIATAYRGTPYADGSTQNPDGSTTDGICMFTNTWSKSGSAVDCTDTTTQKNVSSITLSNESASTSEIVIFIAIVVIVIAIIILSIWLTIYSNATRSRSYSLIGINNNL